VLCLWLLARSAFDSVSVTTSKCHQTNLHSLWDDVIETVTSRQTIVSVASSIMRQTPKDNRATAGEDQWFGESVSLAKNGGVRSACARWHPADRGYERNAEVRPEAPCAGGTSAGEGIEQASEVKSQRADRPSRR
jgi:hypothetical protein